MCFISQKRKLAFKKFFEMKNQTWTGWVWLIHMCHLCWWHRISCDCEYERQAAIISNDNDAATNDESDSSRGVKWKLEDQTISSFDQAIQSLDTSVNITENAIKDSIIQDTNSECKEVLSLDSGTPSLVSGDILNEVNLTKKTESSSQWCITYRQRLKQRRITVHIPVSRGHRILVHLRIIKHLKKGIHLNH